MQIIHPALWKLVRLQRHALLRRMTRGMKTPAGAIFTLLGIGAMFLWLGPSVVLAFTQPRTDGSRVHAVLPVVMVVLCLTNVLTSAGERAVAFLPAEADFLFPGPFTRRQLLVYKLVQGALATAIVSTMFSLIWMRHSQHWINALVGYFLAMQFVQLVSMTAVLAAQSVNQKAATRGKRIILIAAVLLVAAILSPHLQRVHDISAADLPQIIRNSTLAHYVLAPFDIYAGIIAARAVFPDALLHVAMALAINGALLAVVLWLDAHYMEAAALAGQKLHARLQRVRRGGGLTSGGVSARASRFQLPVPPRLGGVGPIAWRQTLSAIRQSRGVFVFVGIIFVGVTVAFGVIKAGEMPVGPVIGGIVWMTITLTDSLRFDFRGDVDRMDTLRALPISPGAIVVAQLVAPVVVLFACQVGMLSIAVAAGKLRQDVLVPSIIAALPLDLLIVELENFIFLLYPSRNVQSTPGDMQGVGFKVVGFIIKAIALAFLLGFAACFGAVAYYLTGGWILATMMVASAIVMLEAIAFVPMLAGAFRRFDPSVDLAV